MTHPTLPPMPPQIAARPRTARGLPVPYVAAWTGETPFVVRSCLFAGGRMALVESGRKFTGTPVLGEMNVTRQREVIARRLCQVCAAPLGAGPRWLVSLFEGDTGVGPMVREPWACASCLAFALGACPRLVGQRRRAEDLFVLAVNEYEVAHRPVASLGVANDGDLAARMAAQHPTAVGYLLLIPTHFDVLDADAFIASHGAKGP